MLKFDGSGDRWVCDAIGWQTKPVAMFESIVLEVSTIRQNYPVGL